MSPCEANTPAVNSKLSPGRKNPKNKPDSANNTPKTPMRPRVLIRSSGFRRSAKPSI